MTRSRSTLAARARRHTIAVAALSLAVSFFVFYFAWRDYVVDVRTRELSRQVSAIAAGLETRVGTDNDPAASEISDRLFSVHSSLLGVALFVTDEDRAVIRSSAEESIPIGRVIPADVLGEHDGREPHSSVRKGDTGTVVFVSVPVANGWLVAAQPVREIVEAQQSIYLLLAASLGLAVVSAWISGGLLARRLTKPLMALGSAATAIAEGDWGRQVDTRGDDEIALLARTFNDMSLKVADAYEAQRCFVADVSHELRTPIASITGWTGALLDGTISDPDRVEHAIEVVAQEAKRLSELVSALLTLAKLDAGTAQPHLQPVDEVALLDAIEARFSLGAASAGIVLETKPGGGQPVADFDRLLQAVSTLIDNALAYTPAGGRVLVSTEHVERTWMLHVDDSGPGIAPEHRQVVFRRFKRLEDSRSTDTGGAGLGLSLALRLAESMGGTIHVGDSDLGGARFTLTLPRVEQYPA